mgnify:CR=1 FL=1
MASDNDANVLDDNLSYFEEFFEKINKRGLDKLPESCQERLKTLKFKMNFICDDLPGASNAASYSLPRSSTPVVGPSAVDGVDDGVTVVSNEFIEELWLGG